MYIYTLQETHMGKGKSSTQKCLCRGCVSSQEGMYILYIYIYIYLHIYRYIRYILSWELTARTEILWLADEFAFGARPLTARLVIPKHGGAKDQGIPQNILERFRCFKGLNLKIRGHSQVSLGCT